MEIKLFFMIVQQQKSCGIFMTSEVRVAKDQSLETENFFHIK